MRVLFVLMFFVFLGVISGGAMANSGVISEISTRNNQRVERATILSYLDISLGDNFNQRDVNTSLKKMFATGLFADVNIYFDAGMLVVDVRENPIINKIGFEGNKRINDDTLSSETELQSRSIYTVAGVQKDTNKIRDMYNKSGRFSATVEPKVVKLDQNRVDVVYEINEGNKANIGKIYFVGNKYFPDHRLKKVINTKESRWYSFYSGGDTYDPDRVAFDKEMLRKFYISKGFADFRVISSTAEITEDKKSFVLTFSIEEGDRYTFGKMDVTSSLPQLQTDVLFDAVTTVEGEIFNASLVDKTIDKMTDSMNDLGYAFVDIKSQYDRDPDARTVGITYKVAEGPKVYINRINIGGNVRTLDKVIRREFRLAEGDPFNAAKIRRSKQRVQNLGFFDKVEIERERTAQPDKADINVKVSEKSTGELSFGAGYSTNDGALANIKIQEHNLLGKGQNLRVGLQRSQSALTLNLGFTEPYFMDRDFSAGFDVWNTSSSRIENATSSVDSIGASVRGSYSLTEHLRHTVRYILKEDTVTNVSDAASSVIKSQAGSTVAGIIGHSLMYDKRDNRFAPKDGFYILFDQKLAGLGGDLRYVRHEASAGYYKPIYKEDVVLKLSASGGHISGYSGKKVRLADNFDLTGRKVRGFETIGFGASDFTDNAEGTVLGGKRYYAGSVEIEVPLVFMPEELGFKGFIFNDLGGITGVDVPESPQIIDRDTLHASAGVGFSWSSPLGPLNVSYAEPYLQEDIDRTQKLQFDFGTRF